MQHTRPSGAEVKAARAAAKLTQTEAAHLVHSELRIWQYWECDAARMPAAKWELFKLKIENLSVGADHE